MIANFQGGNGGVEAADGKLEPFTHCLYFLVCKAKTGPLAGLFKLGISDCLARRHHEHTKRWQEFDLDRSALVRTSSAEEARYLETTLRRVFRGQEAEAKTKAAGRTLSSEDLIALGSSRRHPGRKADGWTEFYTGEAQEPMLELAERLLVCRGVQEAKARVQRGLTPADCAVYVGADGDGSIIQDRGPGSGLRKRARLLAEREHERAVDAARAAAIAGAALELAQDFEEHLLWVRLNLWRWHLKNPSLHSCSTVEGWADLYFGRFGPPRRELWMRSVDEPPPTPKQTRFEEAYQRRIAAAIPEKTGDSRWEKNGLTI